MHPTSRILVTDGGIANDIRQELGSRARVRKVQFGEPVGSYGDHVFQTSDPDAVLMKLKYPDAVRII